MSFYGADAVVAAGMADTEVAVGDRCILGSQSMKQTGREWEKEQQAGRVHQFVRIAGVERDFY